uniref:Odorant receptor 17 n=1 Tax=Conogethes punctiferalis TaxID=1133088 RepID=A0A1X9PBV5_CONPF|nr:odorant receptor 17 [Conogethes punctiferalis]
MENQNPQERTAPIQYVRGSRAFRQFKNPPQPHMCIQDTIKDTTEKLFINVLGWQKIANPKQYNDPIPLYGGMQVPQGCGPNSNRPPLLVFAVMVNPDILKANGKNAANPTDREALVSLLCDFVEAMNPGLLLARNPLILKDRDLAGELKDVWLAVQNKREREKGMTQDVMYKVYDIDGIGGEEGNEEDKMNSKNCKQNECGSPNKSPSDKSVVKSSKQILMNAGQKSEFDSGMNNCQINQTNPNRDNRCSTTLADTTYCTPVYGQIVSSRENHNQINDIQQKFSTSETTKPSSSFRKDWNPVHGKTTEGWDEFSKRNISSISDDSEMKKQRYIKNEKAKQVTNGKPHYNFFPVFDNKAVDEASDPIEDDTAAKMSINQELSNEDNSKIILDAVQKLVLHSTDNKICDNKTSALSSISS